MMYHKTVGAMIAVLSAGLLAGCGGGLDTATLIHEAGSLAPSEKTGTTREVLAEVASETDRAAPITDTQQSQGVTTAFTCTTKTVSLEQNPDTFIQFNPQAGIVYPGALVQGKSIQNEGSLLPIAAKRGPGVVTLDIASGTSGIVSRNLDNVDHASVTQAMNDILAGYDALTPAKASFKMTEVQSSEQLAAEVSANVSGMTFDIATELGFDTESNSTKLLVELKQEYFTMVFQTPAAPELVFAENVKGARLQKQMGPGNPPVYIGSVTFGRLFYMLFESDQSIDEMRASINGAYKAAVSADVAAKAAYSQRLSKTSVNSYGLGGSASGSIGAMTALMDGAEGVEAIWRFFVDDANFSPQSPGSPISFKMVNLADNQPIRMVATSEYDVQECEVVTTGCDGVVGSGKIKDACGVCGGKGLCKRGCNGKTETLGNDNVFIYIDLPNSNVGSTIKIKDLGVAHYYFPRCYHVKVDSLKYNCEASNNGGVWKRSGVVTRDAWCASSGEWDQPHVRVWKRE